MYLSESFQMAIAALNANRLRSALTMVGIIIGNASVITMVGIGQGVQRLAENEFQSLGPNVLFLISGNDDTRRISFETPRTLVLEDAWAIKDQVPSVIDVAPQVNGVGTVVYQSNNTSTQVFGVTPSFLEVRSFEMAQGRFISDTDGQRNERVAVLGCDLVDKLLRQFGEESAIASPNSPQGLGICEKLVNNQPLLPSETLVGQQIRLQNLSFQVVGMTRPKGSFGGTNQDDLVIIPLTTMANRIVGKTNLGAGTAVTFISMAAKENQSRAAKFQVTNLMRQRHGITGKDDFEIRTQEDILRTVGNITGALTLLLVAIAAISLVVGGVGIMNIMLVSVSERTQEIGLRKAIGANHQDILIQFLIEAVIVSALGGAVGTAVGVAGVLLVGATTPLLTQVSGVAVLLSVSVSGTIGLFFGVIPAQQAAKLDPIVALRSA
ncbi:ABC transporter permease [Prochlorothrix hollandica]|uniref:ABC transporter permease n=1 Tax=Prochlorothrix hollandica PCC 9006 = CALU 1027 TaxID=317619 RepID=A0A0M2PSF8_PROHO|nr:ABC transporter permease [Prochlorothrix hollandica]KKI99059.1 ABC transporter permease [Prochlorothrix hollandica PCC 9006 = CALU 1027]